MAEAPGVRDTSSHQRRSMSALGFTGLWSMNSPSLSSPESNPQGAASRPRSFVSQPLSVVPGVDGATIPLLIVPKTKTKSLHGLLFYQLKAKIFYQRQAQDDGYYVYFVMVQPEAKVLGISD